MKKNYMTPDILVMSVINEGVMCTSEEDTQDQPMLLPGTEWKPETIW